MSDSEDDNISAGEDSGDDVDVDDSEPEEEEEEEEEYTGPRRKKSRVEGFILDEAGKCVLYVRPSV